MPVRGCNGKNPWSIKSCCIGLQSRADIKLSENQGRYCKNAGENPDFCCGEFLQRTKVMNNPAAANFIIDLQIETGFLILRWVKTG